MEDCRKRLRWQVAHCPLPGDDLVDFFAEPQLHRPFAQEQLTIITIFLQAILALMSRKKAHSSAGSSVVSFSEIWSIQDA